MNNLELIEKLTQGTQHTETVTIEGEEYQIRPLNSGELSKLKVIEKRGFKMQIGVNNQGKRQTVKTNDVDVDVGEFTNQQEEAMYTAIAWSLSIDDIQITPEMIKQLPSGIPGQLYDHVIRISDLSESDLTTVKRFRKGE